MSENNHIKLEFDEVIDLDDRIEKNILFKDMPIADNDASNITESKYNDSKLKTLIGLEANHNIKNEEQFLNDITKLRQDSQNFSTNAVISENRNTEKSIEKCTNHTPKYCDNIDVLSRRSDSDSLINAELLPTLSPPIKSDICNYPTDVNYDSDSNGYNSSDFEFITEIEAISEGLIDNSPATYQCGPRKYSTIHSSLATSSINSLKWSLTHKFSEGNNDMFQENKPHNQNLSIKDLLESGPSSSFNCRQNNVRFNDLENTSSNIYKNDYPIHNGIPDGEEYFDLFRGLYGPDLQLCDIHMMENKSFKPTSMNADFEGIGFDLRLMVNMDGSSQDEFEEEADDNAKKILQMYPGENRKRRRRR